MLKISDFSKLAQVPVATLRYYDQLGLIKPAQVDKFTDYRYYDVAQLPKLNRILALRDLGFSLEQIARLLKDNISLDEMKGMLTIRQADAARELADTQARLARVEARLQEIEIEGHKPKYDIVVKHVEPSFIVSARQIVPTAEEMGALCWQLHAQLRDWMHTQRIKAMGFPAPELLNLYYNSEYTEENLDVEAAVVAERPKAMSSSAFQDAPLHISIRELDGAPLMASGVHRGNMRDLGQLVKALILWVGSNGYTPIGPLRELHLTPRDPNNRDNRVVEMQIPIEPQIGS
jgi:DNA-binding transcriptional MerR regulator